jgi:hypothetical protein
MNTIINKEKIKISKDSVHTRQSMYKSDIRSMINFLQLNQNFKLNEWDNKILNPSIMNDLHNMFYIKAKQNEIESKIYKISENYNIDKMHLIQYYFNHIVRFKLIDITPEFIKLLKKTIHSINSNSEDTINFLTINMTAITIKPSPYAVEGYA